MPYFPTSTLSPLRPGSWPASPGRPTTPQLDEDEFTDEDDLDMPLLQRDPLRYFLTPATPEDEDLEFQFDFDAGIEDANKPQEIIRSVSPSTLDGLKSYKAKGKGDKKNNNSQHDCAILDSDSDDDEDYVRFRPSKSLPLGLPDLGIERPRSAGASPGSGSSLESMLSPDSFHVGSLRGRPSKRFAPPPSRRTFGHTRSRSVPLLRRHSWREPSPDVWSIEEEPEKETLSERGLSTEDLEAYFQEHKTAPMQIPTVAGKPIKKVRFVLPGRESYH
ncbi:hypothetical protein PFICI_11491 [Pestalotiopsis fici W106-1]|uniref:Uncharacterized protein n=1 Tax=Pestalotiopsis fici (strain W106-1 / CGMCC3.15140) TaxID=1229662 RepID=W3WQL9_PESFW|nr:uncharacterized protein PFICI_11491 [Pestalotiopsis fici W106-1]ETS76104.1 hypothetical protein PFICI_11491 [Pestalotiopsis fici W106-1]